LKKRRHWPQTHNGIVRAIVSEASFGTRFVYVPGKHDKLQRADCIAYARQFIWARCSADFSRTSLQLARRACLRPFSKSKFPLRTGSGVLPASARGA
jgi:hypothetical protein